MECSYAPYNWSQPTADGGAVKINGTNEYAYGYDIMMAKKLADSMGATLEVNKIEWDGLAPAVISGKIDAVIAGMSITSKRKQSVDFTKPYYYASVVALVRADSKQAKAQTIADLTGSSAVSQLNTIWYDLIPQIPQVNKLPAIDTVPGMIVALESGKCDVVVTDIPTGKAAVFANPKLKVINFPEGKGFKTSAEDVEIGIAVKKGNTELTTALNKVLGDMDGFDYKKNFMIITNKPEEIADAIMTEVGRGVTFLNGEGAYTHQSRKVLFVVVKLTQVNKIEHIIKQFDPDAFVIMLRTCSLLILGYSLSFAPMVSVTKNSVACI